MKKITTESLATAFQIAVIIFIFSYSFSPVKNDQPLNKVDNALKQSGYSMLVQKKINDINTINLSYAGNKAHGLLYTQLNIATDFATSIKTTAGNTNYSALPGATTEPITALYALYK